MLGRFLCLFKFDFELILELLLFPEHPFGFGQPGRIGPLILQLFKFLNLELIVLNLLVRVLQLLIRHLPPNLGQLDPILRLYTFQLRRLLQNFLNLRNLAFQPRILLRQYNNLVITKHNIKVGTYSEMLGSGFY